MTHESQVQERIAKCSLEEERKARPVTYLSRLQKEVLKKAEKGLYKAEKGLYKDDGVSHESPEAAALSLLSSLGLLHMISTKEGVGGFLTDKGRLLLYENPKLKFPVEENTRWIVSTTISALAIMIALGSLIVAILSLLR